jgi:hypothetical protein
MVKCSLSEETLIEWELLLEQYRHSLFGAHDISEKPKKTGGQSKGLPKVNIREK